MDKARVDSSDSSVITLEIHDLARGGAGVSRDDQGRVVFVPFTAPGDRVRVRIIEERKNYAQAELIEVLSPSPVRQAPRCPAFGRCGGCQWQHLPYDLQWKTKVSGALHALRRVGIEPPGEVAALPAERIWEYRNRIQLRGVGREMGFLAPGTNQRVTVDRCDIARPEINQNWSETLEEGARLAHPFKVEVEVMPNGQVRSIWNSRHAAGGFRQVHDEQNEKLRAWVRGALTEGSSVLDLYGGAGNLSLELGSHLAQVDCVDLGSPSGERGRILASEWSGAAGSYRFHRAPVEKWVVRQSSLRGKSAPAQPISVILDPPREGLGHDFQEIADSLTALRAREIIAVGCDPDAWARDVSRWVKRGWRLERVAVLDLFPQTPHVESLARLEFAL